MSTTISDGTTDTTVGNSVSLNTVSGLPSIDGSAYTTRGIPLSEYSSPNKSSIDLVGLRGPQGKQGEPGATGQRGQKWIPLALDQTSKIASILSQIATLDDVIAGDYVLDTVSSDVYVLSSLLTPEFVCNIKGKASDNIVGVTPLQSSQYTLRASDASQLLTGNLSVIQNVIIPDDLTPFDIGATIFFMQQGTKAITFSTESGVTIVSAFAKETRRVGSVATISKIAANKWALYGDLKYIDMDKVLDATNISYNSTSPVTIFELALQ
jgi:hypothetical protein